MYKILIVDDEAIERRCISFILENSKYSLEIEEAENGQKAYERLQEKEFDILFSDVKCRLWMAWNWLKKLYIYIPISGL